AIPPAQLRGLVAQCIEQHVDQEQLRVTRVAEESERGILRQLLAQLAGRVSYDTQQEERAVPRLKAETTSDPTKQEYSSFSQAYDFFSRELFSGDLPCCLITLQRRARTYGYYSAGMFNGRRSESLTDEIALNPATFKDRTDAEI